MANIKDLFAIYQNQKVLPSSSLGALDNSIESADFIESRLKLRDEFQPLVDYTSASNFARYGSAKQYYEDSFTYILNEYPYDGSTREKLDWEFDASGLDKYIFDNEYPRTNGYVIIGKDYGTLTPGAGGKGRWSTPSKIEYIHFKGGPHAGPTGNKLSKQFESSKRTDDSANYYSENLNQQSNLELDADRGVTVEFWYKKDNWVTGSESEVQRIVDIYNSLEHLALTRGRFRIDVDYKNVSPHQFSIFYESGSSGFTGSHGNYIGQNLNLTSSTWNHYAFSFINENSSLVARLYVNGEYNDSISTSSVGPILGSTDRPLRGYIGAMGGEDFDSVEGVFGTLGTAKFSGSLDEFRFWKTKRSAEQIGQNWFTQINGGTNTDWKLENNASTKYSFTNPVDLGVYFKFNEGIINSSIVDSRDTKVLDYSGRLTNGTWTGYSVGARQTGSAMVLASAASSEFKDPILYSFHPDVESKLENLKNKGTLYDGTNNSSMYKTLPGWIHDEDSVNERNTLLKLTQVVSSYFDDLHLRIENLPKIKNTDYVSSSFKSYPFINRAISSTGLVPGELFSDANALEVLSDRDDFRDFSKRLDDTKNRIYQNIYNNLVYIFKSKGTEKSIRNLIRCYGIGDELVSLNIYGNNTTFALKDNYQTSISRKRFANFNNSGSHEAVVYQSASASDTNLRSFVSSSSEVIYNGSTIQANVILPTILPFENEKHDDTSITEVSLFGSHTIDDTNPGSNAWVTPDVGNFQVYFVKNSSKKPDGYFKLSSSVGGVLDTLTSSVVKDAYDGTPWNIALRLKPSVYPWMGTSGSTTPTYDVEFLGYNTILDNIENQFKVTGSIPYASGSAFLSSSKRVFVGAHRTNFTGTLLQKSDAKISSLRYWFDYLDDDTILSHAKDLSNYGRKHPSRNSFVSQNGKYFGKNISKIPEAETLALHWNFNGITGSNSSGQFIVQDYSSGSVESSSDYGWLGSITKLKRPGIGYGFPTSWVDAVKREYIPSAKQRLPEVINSDNMIEIRTEDDDVLVRDTRPEQYFFSVEKNMYSIVSNEIINLFASILDFNNLIGEPVNRYRQEYKSLEKARQLFFSKVENNTVDFEKFVDYYKWIDLSIGKMVSQLFPASANFSDKIFTIIESHILERNKYWSKFPSIKSKEPTLNAATQGRGFGSSPYRYKFGSRPANGQQNTNTPYWKLRAKRTDAVISSGDSTIDSQRQTINDQRSNSPNQTLPKLSGSGGTYDAFSYQMKNFSRFLDVNLDLVDKKFPDQKKNNDYFKSVLDFNSSVELNISKSDVDSPLDSLDIVVPNEKKKLNYKLKNSLDLDGYSSGKGRQLTPFSLFSSSVSTGYVSKLSSNFRTSSEINNYHNDLYSGEHSPLQGPFTERHVGGRQYRHSDINTSSADTNFNRAEAWNITVASNNLKITPRSTNEPRATLMREEHAKRPLNIKNIKWGTSSQAIGNYRFDYQAIQTSDRNLNNTFFVKNEGFVPVTTSSPFVSGLVDYRLPNFNSHSVTKHIFVTRFNAPGGPEVSSRGSMDLYGEEYAPANELNQRNSVVRNSLNEWYTERSEKFGIKSGSSPITASYSTVASYHKVNRNPLRLPIISNSESATSCVKKYDNWWVQHQIPRSEYQYNWITASALTRSSCDFYGLLSSPDAGRSNFTVPSGTTSIDKAQISFVSASDISAGGIKIDFAGLSNLIVDDITFTDNTYLATPSLNTELGSLTSPNDVNSYLLKRNGPYQYPSWKQVRTGETQIARFQKKNNTINVGPDKRARQPNGQSFKQVGSTTRYIAPPVTFKNKPLKSKISLVSQPNVKIKLNHTYGNNLSFFSDKNIDNAFNLPSDRGSQPGFTNPDAVDNQAYDSLFFQEKSGILKIDSIKYSEVLFPRDVNTGLKKNKQRPNYAELASGTINAVPTTGTNGIDRGPLSRRTFWRDASTSRNRRISAGVDSYNNPQITGALPNSQGYRSGFATSINGWGETPIVFYATASLGPVTTVLSSSNIDNFTDCGELNSANYVTIGGIMGAIVGNQAGLSRFITSSYLYPTASAYYYHRQMHGNATRPFTSSFGQLKWRVSELAGKNPWYDSYEDYYENIRGIGKNYSVLPEFRMSQHMEYYADSRFRKRNDRYFTLEGGEITASATSEAGEIGGDRGIVDQFFEEYSNTDFQKYFGKFNQNHNLNRITLKCNAIKKLLPYHGFYPSHRTLQLASLFSQSIAPHIGGIAWRTGSSAVPGAAPSGALATQALLQPYFAPGILYNTIKSGIACDWSAFTGSAVGLSGFVGNGYLSQSSNYRIPFESLVDPLGDIGIPASSSNGFGKLNLLYPTYEAYDIFNGNRTARSPFMDLSNASRETIQGSTKYNSYQRAMSNFLAEIPNFFLENQSLTKIVSRPAGELKTSFISGTTYYMDITLHKSDDLVMIEDYLNGTTGSTINIDGTAIPRSEIRDGLPFRSWNGKFFGPPTLAGTVGGADEPFTFGKTSVQISDPAYAPYTPPYFYGKSRLRIAYTADADDAAGNFNYGKLQQRSVLTQTNDDMDKMFERLTGSNSAAKEGAMPLSASVNVFGLLQEKTTIYDENGAIKEFRDSVDTKKTRWVISPRFETPILNFTNQPREKGYGRGMWSGYGDIPNDKSGVVLSLEKSDPELNLPSLLDICFDKTDQKQIGKLATKKQISEAIVAIPYISEKIEKNSNKPFTVELYSRRFFGIDEDIFEYYRSNFEQNKLNPSPPPPEIRSESLEKMIKLMDKYIIPPEFDFLTYAKVPGRSEKTIENVKPFVMYIFEFNHTLNDQDLADIWQGVMPRIAQSPQISDQTVDDNVFSHATGDREFFHNKKIPEDIKWMVFKVKRKANFDYFAVTADTQDDDRLGSVMKSNVPYSYNWPYDFFTMVELAQLEIENDFSGTIE